MEIKCNHGFYRFFETYAGEVSDFIAMSGIKLVSRETYFTFEPLEAAPKYSLKAKPLIGLPAIQSFEGEPWEVFEANGFVYDFNLGTMRPILSIENKVDVQAAGNRFYSNGLILAGSLNQISLRIKSYSAWYSRASGVFLYSEVTYV